jgi:hypothetical protein
MRAEAFDHPSNNIIGLLGVVDGHLLITKKAAIVAKWSIHKDDINNTI